MRRRSWSWFVVLVGLLTAALVTASLAAPPADLERRAATLAPDEAPTAEELQRQMAEADRAIALLYEARRSPKARAERERSRAAYSPHVKFETRHVGPDGRVSYTSGPVREATHADLRIVARILAERGR
jgi:hypothetical protein